MSAKKSSGFTKGQSPFASRDAAIARLQREVAELKRQPLLDAWVKNDFLGCLGVMLAFNPIEQWPEWAFVAFDNARCAAPACAEDYLARKGVTREQYIAARRESHAKTQLLP